jgi:hypothetical protein
LPGAAGADRDAPPRSGRGGHRRFSTARAPAAASPCGRRAGPPSALPAGRPHPRGARMARALLFEVAPDLPGPERSARGRVPRDAPSAGPAAVPGPAGGSGPATAGPRPVARAAARPAVLLTASAPAAVGQPVGARSPTAGRRRRRRPWTLQARPPTRSAGFVAHDLLLPSTDNARCATTGQPADRGLQAPQPAGRGTPGAPAGSPNGGPVARPESGLPRADVDYQRRGNATAGRRTPGCPRGFFRLRRVAGLDLKTRGRAGIFR